MKRYISLFMIICLLFMVSGCLFKRYEQENDYNNNVIELEIFILEELDDFICIDEVELSQYPEHAIASKGKYAGFLISFEKDYLGNKSLLSEKPPMQIVERFRELFNQFMKNNPDYYISGYDVSCRFWYPRRPYSLEYAELSNLDQNYMPYGDELSTLFVHKYYYNIGVDFPFGEWDYFYQVTDIKAIFLDYEYTLEEAVELSDNMPFLEYVIVPTDEIAQEASGLRPGVVFVKSEMI